MCPTPRAPHCLLLVCAPPPPRTHGVLGGATQGMPAYGAGLTCVASCPPGPSSQPLLVGAAGWWWWGGVMGDFTAGCVVLQLYFLPCPCGLSSLPDPTLSPATAAATAPPPPLPANLAPIAPQPSPDSGCPVSNYTTLAAGEDLAAIAAKFHLDFQALLAANPSLTPVGRIQDP